MEQISLVQLEGCLIVSHLIEFGLAADVDYLQRHLVDIGDESVDPRGCTEFSFYDKLHCILYCFVVRADEEGVF